MPSSTFSTSMAPAARTAVSRVPRSLLGGLDDDEPARKALKEQDNAIAERAGRPRVLIKKISRSPV